MARWFLPLSLVAALLLGGCGRLDRDALDTELGKLESAAAEGTLVAQQAAQRRAPDNFIEIRLAEMLKQATDVFDEFSETPAAGEPGLKRAQAQGLHLAAHIERLLAQLHGDSENRGLASSVAQRLTRLAAHAHAVRDSL